MAPAIKALAAAAATAPLLSACVVYDSTGGDEVSVRVGSQTTTAASAPLETLRAVRFEAGAVVVRVESNGCTDASDFAVEVTDGTASDLVFTREQPDLCKVLVPDGVELRWTYDDLGLASGRAVAVRNPVRLP